MPLPFRRTIYLCAAIAAGTVVAAVLAAMEVESITISLPLLAGAGLILSIVGFRYASFHLLTYSLFQPAVAIMVATSIVAFDLSPHEADPIVFVLGVNAIVCAMWGFALVIRLLTTPPEAPWVITSGRAASPDFR